MLGGRYTMTVHQGSTIRILTPTMLQGGSTLTKTASEAKQTTRPLVLDYDYILKWKIIHLRGVPFLTVQHSSSRGVSGGLFLKEKGLPALSCPSPPCPSPPRPAPSCPAPPPDRPTKASTHLLLSLPSASANTMAASRHSTTRMLYLQGPFSNGGGALEGRTVPQR